MESGSKQKEPEPKETNGSLPEKSQQQATSASRDEDVAQDIEVADEEEGEEEEHEPKLKYTKLTGHLSSVYRSGDSTSAFLASGDKLFMGTHNGAIQVVSMPNFETLRQYQAHASIVTAVSVSPYSPLITPKSKPKPPRTSTVLPETPPRSAAPKFSAQASPKSPRQQPSIAATADNAIHVATASIDGHVCVFSLIDSKDVTRRNYARPLHAVALSPEFKSDRSFLCGGIAGNLILTSGAKTGTSSDANINSSAAGPAWLGSIGLGSSSGKDTVLHSGEGAISAIAWSLSGRYVAWVNEQGIKIMRSNLHLSSQESESAWKRLAHLDLERPNRQSWEDMAAAWKARLQWADDQYLESSLDLDAESKRSSLNATIAASLARPQSETGSIRTARTGATSLRTKKPSLERLIVGWGDTIWIVHVTSTFTKPEVAHKLRFDDCIVSGVALYTPSLLLLLAFRTKDDNNKPLNASGEETPKKGMRKKGSGLPPDLRMIDLDSTEEDKTVEIEGLEMKDFDRLASGDYHMSTVFVPTAPQASLQQRGTVEAITSGFWDASAGASRLFSSGASVLSGSSGEKTLVASSAAANTAAPPEQSNISAEPMSFLLKPGLKTFIQSPFDCLVAVKTERSDKLAWLLENSQYEAAWNLIDQYPEIISTQEHTDSRPGSPLGTPRQSLNDFFVDDSSSQAVSTANEERASTTTPQEKLRIGELWLQQLVKDQNWDTAGATAPKVLGRSPKWTKWIGKFIEANRIDSISPYIPITPLKPRISSEPYETVLAHYISEDRLRLLDLLNEWDPSLFDQASVASQIEARLQKGDLRETSTEDGIQGRDWKILLDCLAKLYLADGRVSDALRCYLRTKNGDAALALVAEYDILQDIEDVYEFILLRVAKYELPSLSINSLEGLTAEPIRLLISAAISGLIPVEHVVQQLQGHLPTARPLLFFYLRALWLGKAPSAESESIEDTAPVRRTRFNRNLDPITSKSRNLLTPHGELCVSLFAEYSRALLNDLLKTTDIYNFNHAIAECQSRHYTPELVHLLTRTGRPHDALHLIIDELGDVTQAIAFAQDQDDQGIWEDLIQYSMDKPKFIIGLLEHGGGGGAGSIDARDLVRRIPDKLEIEGLKAALQKLLKQAEIQCSISEGAARVFRGEVGTVLDILKRGRSKGIAVDAITPSSRRRSLEIKEGTEEIEQSSKESTVGEAHVKPEAHRVPASFERQGGVRCSICSEAIILQKEAVSFRPSSSGSSNHEHSTAQEPDNTLLVSSCGHVHHLRCLLDSIPAPDPDLKRRINNLLQSLSEKSSNAHNRQHPGTGKPKARVGDKVARAQMVAGVFGDDINCSLCAKQHEQSGT